MISFRCTVAAALTASFIALVPAIAGAAASQQASLQSLTGTWTCVSRSSDNKTYRETDTNSMYGGWLRSDGTYAAQAGQPAGTSVTFVGYDAKAARWVVSSVGTDGSHFVAASSSPSLSGSVWTDIYPADRGGTVLRLTSATQYTLDSHGPNPQGKMTTSHTVCSKQ